MLTSKTKRSHRRRSSEGDEYYCEAITELIRLHIRKCDLTREIYFDFCKLTPFWKLKKGYCKLLHLNPKKLRFVHNGHEITDDDTAYSLHLLHKSIINVYNTIETE